MPTDLRLLARVLLCGASLVYGGCGWKTGIETPPPLEDGGTRGLEDGGTPELLVECGRREQYSSPRRPLTLMAEVEGSVSIFLDGWILLSRPLASSRGISPEVGPVTTLTPDVEGDFVLRYDVEDALGRMASCEVTVHSVVGPPIALCPEDELRTGPGAPINVEGDGYDDEAVVAYAWSVLSTPGGAPPSLAPRDTPSSQFIGTTPGLYELELTVWDRDGATGSCVAPLRVTTPPLVTCPEGPVLAPTRQATTLRATATDDTGIASVSWEVVSTPPMSAPGLRPSNRESTRFTPDRQGAYLLRFTAEDVDGESASCEVTVEGTPTPPTAICPGVRETRPLEPIRISGDAIDDGQIVAWSWQLISSASGSGASPPSPGNAQVTNFTPDIVGEYRLRLTVTDDDGQRGSCDAIISGVAYEGLRVEVFWDAAPDMDLHLLHPHATAWNGSLDCYYANCNASAGNRLDWFSASTLDDPHLDLDVIDSFGPENINIEEPADGVYRIGVHAYTGPSNAVNVRIYCGASSTTPAATFGPIVLLNNYLWRVADVTISAGGCSVGDLAFPGGAPNTEPFNFSSEPR